MVLETLTSPDNAERHKFLMLAMGFSFSIVACIITYIIANPAPGMFFVFLTALPLIPIMYAIIKFEEEKDVIYDSEKKLVKEHGKALEAFMFLFFGMVMGFTLFFVSVPKEVSSDIFDSQLDNLAQIHSNSNIATGMATGTDGAQFIIILINNLRVLAISLIFSFLFGAGAIFVLTWNASMIAAAIGSFLISSFAIVKDYTVFSKMVYRIEIITVGFLMYAVHGIPEILGYFTGALAGGIISVAVIKHEVGTRSFKKILWDSTDLILISIGLLILAAFLEVFVTPLLF